MSVQAEIAAGGGRRVPGRQRGGGGARRGISRQCDVDHDSRSHGTWARRVFCRDLFIAALWVLFLSVLSSRFAERLSFQYLVQILRTNATSAQVNGTSWLFASAGDLHRSPTQSPDAVVMVQWLGSSTTVGDDGGPLQEEIKISVQAIQLLTAEFTEEQVASYLQEHGIPISGYTLRGPLRRLQSGDDEPARIMPGYTLIEYPERTIPAARLQWPWLARLLTLGLIAGTMYSLSFYRTLRLGVRHLQGRCIRCRYPRDFEVCPECGLVHRGSGTQHRELL
jgi:hypothetical protein